MDTEQIKGNIKISELAISLGLEVRNGKALCPWHNEKTPSLSFEDKKGIFNCFGCDMKGDAITLYQKMKGVDFKTACEALGSSATTFVAESNTEVPNQPNAELYEHFIEYLYSKGRGTKVDAYLKDRGFTEETLSQFMIAGIDNVEETKQYLLDFFGKETLQKAGLIGKLGFLFSNHPVIIPVMLDGKIVSVRGRSIEDVKLKYLQAVGIPIPLFNSDEKAETIYLTEGEFDAMTLSQAGVTAYGISGVNGFKDEFKKFFENKDVILAFDNDEAGKRATTNIAEILKETVNSLQSLIFPEGIKDCNECLKKGINVLGLNTTILKEGIRIVKISDIAKLQKEEMSLEKIPIGFSILDEAFQGGLRAGNAIIVAALAGEGKTALMQTISYHYAEKGILSLWFSYEETMAEIWDRFELMGVDASQQLYAPFNLEDSKIDFIEKAIERQKKTTPFFIVFIDQLFNLFPKIDGKQKMDHLSNNHSLFLGIMSTQLKAIAMKHKIIVFTAHQLNKAGDLSYSDMVRHAPDKVIYISREEASSGSEDQFTDKTVLKINKNRPFGTRPIIDMTVSDGRFVPYGFLKPKPTLSMKGNPLNIFL